MNDTELVNQLAFTSGRNETIVALVGAINASDLAQVTLRSEAKAALIDGLQYQNVKVHWWCLQLMDHLADETFIPHILPLLDDPVGKVRRHAVHALTCDVCRPDRCGFPGRTTVVQITFCMVAIRSAIIPQRESANFCSDQRDDETQKTAIP